MSFAISAAPSAHAPAFEDQHTATQQMIHDFLDHFRAASERLQNALRAPAQTFELADWRPRSIQAHMATYGAAVCDGYERLPEDFRLLFEDLAHELDTKGTAVLVAIRRQQRRALLDDLSFAELCTRAGQNIQDCLRRAEFALNPLRAVPKAKRPQLEVIANVLMG
jgi:hypothetical protein